MCRSIKTLRRAGEPATANEIEAAALQFVRKVSGYRQPSKANAEAFQAAVADVTAASRRLLEVVGEVQGSSSGRGGGAAGAADPRAGRSSANATS